MMHGIGSPSSANSVQLTRAFGSSGTSKVSQNNFIPGPPPGAGGNKAGEPANRIDGGTSRSDMANPFQRMADPMQAAVIQMQGGQMQGGQMQGGAEGGGPDPSDMFDTLDADDNGKVSRDEFVAGRPDEVSETDAGKLFDQIAGNAGSATDGLTSDQLAEAMQARRPEDGRPRGGGPGPAGGRPPAGPDPLRERGASVSQDSAGTSSSKDTAVRQLLEQLLSAASAYGKTASANHGTASTTTMQGTSVVV